MDAIRKVIIDGNEVDLGGTFTEAEVREMVMSSGIQKNVENANIHYVSDDTIQFENRAGSNGLGL